MSTSQPETTSRQATKNDLRNLRRRECRAGQAKQVGRQVVADASAEAEKLLQHAREEAAILAEKLLQHAREEAAILNAEAAAEKAATQARIRELQMYVKDLHARLNLQDDVPCCEDHIAEVGQRNGALLRQQRAQEKRRMMVITHAENDASDLPNRAQRSEAHVVTQVVKYFKNLTKYHNLASKKSIMQRFWMHTAMRKLHPTSFGCPKQDLSWKTAAIDLKRTLKVVKFARRKDHKAAKDVILSSLVGEEVVSKRYQTALAKALGVKRAPICKASKIRVLLDGDESLRFPMGQRKERSDRLSSHIRGEVAWFWEVHTRVSPNKNGNARKRISPKLYVTHKVHWLEDTEAEYYFKFQEWLKVEKKDYTLGLRSFQALKPYFIRTLKDRNVCCCKQHVETHLLCKAFFKQRQKLHPPNCACMCVVCIPPLLFEGPAEENGTPPQPDAPQELICRASKCSTPCVREWVASTLCKKGHDDRWHKRDCYVGTCEDCGPGLLTLCPWEERMDPKEIVKWETYEYVLLDDLPKPHSVKKIKADRTQGKKRLRLVSKETSMRDFMEKVYSTLEDFVKHDFYARWQGEQYQNCLKTFQKGTIVSSIDFAENFTFAVQDEVQSLHWDNRQITILVLITYRHQHDREEDDPVVFNSSGEQIIRFMEADYHFFISDDNSHDTFFVQHCLEFHFQWMKEQGFLVEKHIMWSDGCAAQFKACRPFSYVSQYYHKHGAPMTWCFHASGHGKGVQDGLEGGVKSALRKEQLRTEGGHVMDGAKDVVAFLKERFCLGKEKEYDRKQGVRRFFWEIGVTEVQRNQKNECLPIAGVRKMHSFFGYSQENPMMLKCRELACFCDECVLDPENVNSCENQAHVKPWNVDHVFPLQPIEIARIIEDMHDGLDAGDCDHDDYIGDLVKSGDYFAVLAEEGNKWNAQFYIMLCKKSAHVAKIDFTDGYGEKFLKGERLLAGIWYQQYGRSNNNFVRYQKAELSYVHVSSMVHIKFGLVPTRVVSGSPGFKLSKNTYDAILVATKRANPEVSAMNLYS